MAKVMIEDLSGTSTPVTSNPYDGILQACNNNPKLIQDRYHQHRLTRNQQQKEKILSDNFSGWILDEHLVKLVGHQRDPNYTDPRNCLALWARPTQKVKNLIDIIQQKLKAVAPDLWLMPLSNLHMTALEVTHSLTAPEIDNLVSKLLPSSKQIADYPSGPGHRARLIKPIVSYDAAALALSFVPAAGEVLPPASLTPGGSSSSGSNSPQSKSATRKAEDDTFTYHHLRRDLQTLTSAFIPISSRYVVPSAHLTIARFNSPNPFASRAEDESQDDALNPGLGISLERRRRWVREIETINKWLENEFWPKPGGERIRPGGQWIVGDEKGLDLRKGTLWYGGGETVYLGKEF